MEIDEIKNLVENIDSWLSHKEGELLYNSAKNCSGEGVIVEIGSWKGRSTIWLAKGSKKGNKGIIYAIDPHVERTFEEFKENIKNAKVDDLIIPIVETSEEAAKNFHEPVELIFIDGDHSYDSVKLDLQVWFPKLIDGGIIAFHDTTVPSWWPGPSRVVEELVYKSKKFRNVRYIESITLAEKVRKNSIKDRLRNRYVLLLKNLRELLYYQLVPNIPKPLKMFLKKLIRLIH